MSEDQKIQRDHQSGEENTGKNGDGIFEKYTRIQINEHHFNKMETEIRKLASIWLLAALGALAFFVRGAYIGQSGESLSMMNPKALITVICLMGTIGLLVLWILDQMVYHRLLNAVFLLGLRMEYLYKNLPPIRTLMMLFSSNLGMARYLRWYYLVPMFGLAVMGIISSIWYLAEKWVSTGSAPTLILNYVPLLLGLITLLIPFIVSRLSKRTEIADLYEINARAFGDSDFVNYLSKRDFKSVLAHH